MSDRWIKRWEVPKSAGTGYWIVAIDKDGNYGCSCPVWKFKRQECHHIKQIKMNGGIEIKPENRPKPVLANVNTPIYNEETNELLLPLLKIPDLEFMEATICFHLFKHGYSWKEIKEIRQGIPCTWTMSAILEHVRRNGIACYGKTKTKDIAEGEQVK